MHPIALFRASAFIRFFQFLEGIGAPVERRLAESGVPLRALDEPETLIPLNRALRFLDRNASKEGIPELGFAVGAATHLENLGVFGRIVRQSVTLGDAFAKVARLIPKYSSAERIWMSRHGDRVHICHDFQAIRSPHRQYGDQFVLMLITDIVRHAAGPRWQPDEVYLTQALLELAAGVHAFERARLKHGATSGISIPIALLATRLDPTTPEASNCDRADICFLESTAPAPDFLGSVKQVISTHLRGGACTVEGLADIVGASIRTVQRALAREDVTFAELLAQMRFDTAMRLIDDPTVKVIDVAYELGYSDPANFTRAFRQWTGMSPTDARRMRLDGAAPSDPGRREEDTSPGIFEGVSNDDARRTRVKSGWHEMTSSARPF